MIGAGVDAGIGAAGTGVALHSVLSAVANEATNIKSELGKFSVVEVVQSREAMIKLHQVLE